MKKEYLLLGLIFVAGIFLRFYQLGRNPASMYWDEIAISLDAYALNETGKDMNDHNWLQATFGSYGDFKAPVLIWLATLSIRFLGMNAFAVRLPVTIFSCFLIILVYFLTKEILSFDNNLTKKYRLLPLLTSFIISINPWSVHFGRIGFESSLSVFWFTLALFLFLKGIKKNGFYFVLASLSCCLGIYTYYSLRVIVPFLFLFLGTIFIRKILPKKWWAIISILLFIGANIPIINSPYYARSQQYRFNSDNLIRPNKIIFESSNYLEKYNSNFMSRFIYHRYLFWVRDFGKNYFSHFTNDFLFFSGDQNLRQHSGYFGEFFLLFLPFLYLGYFILAKNFKVKLTQIIFLLLLFLPLPAAMVYEVPHSSRAIYLFVPFSIIIGLGINEFINFISKKRFKNGLLVLLSLFMILNFAFFYLDYFIDYPKRSSEKWLYAYTQTSEYIKENYNKFSEIKIDGVYWFPDLYVYYQFPEILIDRQKLKKEIFNDSESSFGLDNPFDYLIEEKHLQNAGEKLILKPKANFVRPEEIVPEGYKVEKEFYFLDGNPSLNLIVGN